VAVFTICPEQWLREHDWSDAKVDLILRTLEDLKSELGKLNIPLKIIETPRFDGVAGELLRLARETRCTALFFNREYEVNESRRDEAVMRAFIDAGLEAHAYTDQVVFAPGEVLSGSNDWYTVFTPFKKRWRAQYKNGDAPETLPRCKKQPGIDVRADAIPGDVEGFDRGAASVRPDLWGAGEKHARDRLRDFIKRRGSEYDEQRNYPAVDGTSMMSPYLTMGIISPRQCIEEGLKANGGKLDTGDAGLVAWMDEIIWREFYKHVLVAFPRVCMHRPFRKDMDTVGWSYDEDAFRRWQEGTTGYPIIDAAMRQLAQTGWMHNRLRMAVAMFLTKDLMIDWRWGERHFMRLLIDGDLASNNGGWQWSSSTGTDSQPYFRIFNPTTQGQRFDKDGVFIRRYVPELAEVEGKAIHEPHGAGLFDQLEYPEPMVDHKKARERALKAFKAASSKS